MKVIKYKPIRLPLLRLIICGVILAMLISTLTGVVNTISRNVNYPYREVQPEKLYYISENEKIESCAERKHVVLFYKEDEVYNTSIHMLVLTPEKKLVYIMGNSEEMGDYYSFELMMTKNAYDSYSFTGGVYSLDKETRKNLESHITGDLLKEYGVTSDDISDVYIRMEIGDSRPEIPDIMPGIMLSVLYAVLICIGLWPFLRNRIYHSRVKSGKMEMDPLEISEEGLDYHPQQLYHAPSDDFWLINNSGLDKDENDGYYNNINMSDNDGDNGNTYN